MRRSFPGTFAVRPATLRAVYMDLADELGAQKFRWVFLMNAHGAPSHSRALLDACDYYHDTYGFSMVHLFWLAPVAQWFQDAQRLWSEPERHENGFLVHADMLETSSTLFLRPSAVKSNYVSGPSIPAPAMATILENSFSVLRFPDMIKDDPEQAKVDNASARFDAEIEKRQSDWLEKQKR